MVVGWYWWEYKKNTVLSKATWPYTLKTSIFIPINPVMPFLGLYPNKIIKDTLFKTQGVDKYATSIHSESETVLGPGDTTIRK